MNKRVVTLIVLALGFALPLLGAPADQENNPLGRQLFVRHCARCHGSDGKGSAAIAEAMIPGVPDLTAIPWDGGPRATLRVKNIISGEMTVPSHYSREMPLFGERFRRMSWGGVGMAELNAYALARYVEQIRNGAPPPLLIAEKSEKSAE